MSYGIRKKSSNDERVIQALTNIEDRYIQSLKDDEVTGSLGFTGSIGSGSPNTGDYLHRDGDILLGRLGLFHEITTIKNGMINLSKNTGVGAPFVIVNPEGGQPDELHTILPGANVYPNTEVYLCTFNQNITFKPEGNIQTPNSADLIVPPDTILKMVYTSKLSKWVIISSSDFTSSATRPTDYVDLGEQDGTSSLTLQLDGDKEYIRVITLANPTPLVFGITSQNLPENKIVEMYLICIQDSTGGRSIGTPSATIFPDGALLNTALEMDPDALTKFRFTTYNGGTTWFIEKVTLADVPISPLLADLDVNSHNLLNIGTLEFDVSETMTITSSALGIAYNAHEDGRHRFNVQNGVRYDLIMEINNDKILCDVPVEIASYLEIDSDNHATDYTITGHGGQGLQVSATDNMLFTMSAGNNNLLQVAGFATAFPTLINIYGEVNMDDNDITDIGNLEFQYDNMQIRSTVAGLSYDAPAGDAHRFQIWNSDDSSYDLIMEIDNDRILCDVPIEVASSIHIDSDNHATDYTITGHGGQGLQVSATDNMLFTMSAGNNNLLQVAGFATAFPTLINIYGEVNMDDNDITDIGNLEFQYDNMQIRSTVAGLSYDAPAGDAHRFQIWNSDDSSYDLIMEIDNDRILCDVPIEVASSIHIDSDNHATDYTITGHGGQGLQVSATDNMLFTMSAGNNNLLQVAGFATAFPLTLINIYGDIIMNDYQIRGIDLLEFDVENQTISSHSNRLGFDIPANDFYVFSINNDNIFQIGQTAIILDTNTTIDGTLTMATGHDIDANNNDLLDVDGIYFHRSPGDDPDSNVDDMAIRSFGTGIRIDIPENDRLQVEIDGNIRLFITETRTVIHTLGVANDIEIDGAFNHDGNTVGFYGAVPVSQTSISTTTSTDPAELRSKVNEVILALKVLGLVG